MSSAAVTIDVDSLRFYRAIHGRSGAPLPLSEDPIYTVALERFYALSEPLISRFYSGRSSLGDRVRLLAGRPPVPLVCAARAALIPRRVL